MKKIVIKIEKDYLTFAISNSEFDTDINKTNLIDIKNLKFSEEYILKNIQITSSLLKVICIKENINKVIIKNIEIAATILELLNNIDIIKSIYFNEDINLNYVICNLLIKNKYINYINCYGMPEFIFDSFSNNVKVDVRSEILTTSTFMNENNIHTYSDIYYKKEVIVDSIIEQEDVEELKAFLRVNKKLKVIKLRYYYSKNTLLELLNLLKHRKNICVKLIQTSDNVDLLFKDIDYLKKVYKKYKIKILIDYTKEYKSKNILKQFNLNMLKLSLLLIFFSSVSIYFLYRYIEQKDFNASLKDNAEIEEKISEIVLDNTEFIQEELSEIKVETTYSEKDNKHTNNKTSNITNSSYENKVYDELVKINSDTIGWLKLNNTKIDHPVVQAIDNDYYLKHSYNKEGNSAGWIFADFRNNFEELSKNTIIYGHNARANKIMFGSLESVLDENWRNDSNNLIIDFSVKGAEYKWQIFSIYTIPKTSDYLKVNFITNFEFLEFANMLKDRSLYNFGIEINENDKILTLSTCYKSNGNRLVVHAKQI